MQFTRKTGFTIIELLVVVSIIAVLAVIVLVSVTNYFNKGKDSGARGNLATALTNGAAFYDANSSFEDWITAGDGSTGDDRWLPIYAALNNAGYAITASCDVANCGAGSTAWCALIPLKESGNTYCVDSSGNKAEKAGGVCVSGACS